MRLKGRASAEVRRWKRLQEELGYLPHFHRVGRILKEVVFLRHPEDRRWWVVKCVATLQVLFFNKNGHPRNGERGRLVGPLVNKRRVKK